MATNEPEVTEAVDLCLSDGRTLRPAARGWSRLPFQTANFRGRWGRTKRWDYWGILAGDLVISVTYADVDYLGLVDVWWADLSTGEVGGHNGGAPLGRGVQLPEKFGSAPMRFDSRKLQVTIDDDDEGTHLQAIWTERGGAAGRLDATVVLPEGHESLNVVIPWSDTTFQYTSKHQARPAYGELVIGDIVRRFGIDGDDDEGGDIDGGDEAWGVLDVGRGRWPYRTNWNWGGGAGHGSDADGSDHIVGLQLGGKWTVGTGFTENGIIVDGVLTKIGDELEWDYDWDHPLKTWKVRAPGGELDLILEPRYDKHTHVEAGVMGMHVHQVFGHWSGTVTTDSGLTVTFEGLQGFAEESRSRW